MMDENAMNNINQKAFEVGRSFSEGLQAGAQGMHEHNMRRGKAMAEGFAAGIAKAEPVGVPVETLTLEYGMSPQKVIDFVGEENFLGHFNVYPAIGDGAVVIGERGDEKIVYIGQTIAKAEHGDLSVWYELK